MIGRVTARALREVHGNAVHVRDTVGCERIGWEPPALRGCPGHLPPAAILRYFAADTRLAAKSAPSSESQLGAPRPRRWRPLGELRARSARPRRRAARATPRARPRRGPARVGRRPGARAAPARARRAARPSLSAPRARAARATASRSESSSKSRSAAAARNLPGPSFRRVPGARTPRRSASSSSHASLAARSAPAPRAAPSSACQRRSREANRARAALTSSAGPRQQPPASRTSASNAWSQGSAATYGSPCYP
jgi:hypothetical protein